MGSHSGLWKPNYWLLARRQQSLTSNPRCSIVAYKANHCLAHSTSTLVVLISLARRLFPSSRTMFSIRLPVEVWEIVIDFACSDDNYRRYDTLRACALTCRAWLPRSRVNLFRRVRFRRPNQVNRLLHLISDYPVLADNVLELHVTPAETHKHGWFPFANAPLVQKLKNVRKLRLSEVQWNALPPTYYTFIGKYARVSSMELANVVFHSARDFLHLLWALPALERLDCGLNHFTQPCTPGDCEKLMSIRRPSACSRLVYLSLWSLDKFPPILPVLTRAITDLVLHQPDSSWPWESICEAVVGYVQLRTVTLSICVGYERMIDRIGKFNNSDNNAPGSAENPNETFMDSKQRVVSLLSHIQSPTFHTFSLRLTPSIIQNKTAHGTLRSQFTYYSTRQRAIALVFGPELKAAFASAKSQGAGPLSLLHVYLQEHDLAHDAQWWCAALRASVGGPVPREIRVDVDYFSPFVPRGRFDYSELWLDDEVPSGTDEVVENAIS